MIEVDTNRAKGGCAESGVATDIERDALLLLEAHGMCRRHGVVIKLENWMQTSDARWGVAVAVSVKARNSGYA